MSKANVSVSVIVPTYHDWDRTNLCLQALRDQSYPDELLEIIVVNNDPDDNPMDVLSSANVSIISEGKVGSYAARNAGIRASGGEILLFTDADCVPCAHWVEAAVNALQGGAQRVAGRIEVTVPGGKLSIAERYETVLALDQERSVRRGACLTANAGAWRTVFDEVGLFNDSLLSGGDIEWGLRAYERGIDISYIPEMVVMHPARSSMRALFAKVRRVAGGMLSIKVPPSPLGVVWWSVRCLVPPVRSIAKVRQRDDLTLPEKVTVWAVHYLLRLYLGLYVLVIYSGLRTAPRQ